MTDSPATTPVRQSEVRAALRNPDSNVASLDALRTVILYTFTDAFGLVTEETLWVGYHLDEILAVLMNKTPENVPIAVRQEMLEGVYSAALQTIELRDDRDAAVAWDKNTVHATAQDWAAVTMQTITECYQMRPLEESAMHGKIVGVLRELGVDSPTNPRAARYLPNDVRHRLNHS